jgi:hypothetical protein
MRNGVCGNYPGANESKSVSFQKPHITTTERRYTVVVFSRAPVLVALLSFAAVSLWADALSCREVGGMAGMARANSVAALIKLKAIAGSSYRANVVFSFRRFQLRRDDTHAAAEVLGLIPRNSDEDSVWHTFGHYHCDAESERDLRTLAALGERLPHDLARAVLVVPGKMDEYVSYAYASIQYPDSDYAVQMQSVCRKRKPQFLRAVDSLPLDQRQWFIAKIFDPKSCRALKLPEAN